MGRRRSSRSGFRHSRFGRRPRTETLEHLGEIACDDLRFAVGWQLAKDVSELDAVDDVLDEDGIEEIPRLTSGLEDVEQSLGELVLAPAMHVDGSLPLSFDHLGAGISAPVVVPFPHAPEEVFDVTFGNRGHIGLVLRHEVLHVSRAPIAIERPPAIGSSTSATPQVRNTRWISPSIASGFARCSST